ncbi:hypothetical protein KKE60_08605 [Patescibacteria group bacterium]|nr:hypothetical protein [Patescibacteria group bacterium]
MNIIEWFKRLFRIRKRVVTKTKVGEVTIVTDIPEVKELAQSKQREIDATNKELVAIGERIETLKREALELARGPRNIGRGIDKQLKIEAIRRKNRERQRSTLGHGLSGKFFKPRPAFEKKNWRLDKKADDD